MTTKKDLILFYGQQLCNKIDAHVDNFVKKMDAKGEEKTYIEKMCLEPLDNQIDFLIEKIQELK